MDRQDVLGRDGHDPQQADQQPFDLATATGMLPVDHRQGLVGQRMGQSRLGNRHRKRAEQRIGQRHRRPTAQAAVERLEGRVDAKATGQPPHQRPYDQRDDHMHAGQAEYQHDADRGNYCIHCRYLWASEKSPAGSLREPPADKGTGFIRGRAL
ncbi:hypothetical protein D3C76_1143210 [compost metagenome]